MDSHQPTSVALSFVALLVLVLLAAIYSVATARQRRGQHYWSNWRLVSWLGGIGLLIIAIAPPLVRVAHHDLRAHMVQHLLVGMFAPLGLVLAAPLTLLLRTLPVSVARRIVKLLRSRPLHWLGHPLSAFSLNIGGVYLLYLTPLYALSLRNPFVHLAIAFHFLAAGCLFTWVIAGPDPAPNRPHWPIRLAVLFCSIAAHATLARLMYAFGLPRGTVYTPAQLEAAAQLMYYGGDLAELLLAICLFAIWYRAANRPAARISA